MDNKMGDGSVPLSLHMPRGSDPYGCPQETANSFLSPNSNDYNHFSGIAMNGTGSISRKASESNENVNQSLDISRTS